MSAHENVLKLLKEWKPDKLPTELKYRDSLAALLREKLKDAKIEVGYQHSGTTNDIYVKQSGFWDSTQVFVELKRNFQHRPQLDQLIGEIESLEPKRNWIIVALCGDTNPALVTRFREKYKPPGELFVETKVILVVKQPEAAAKA